MLQKIIIKEPKPLLESHKSQVKVKRKVWMKVRHKNPSKCVKTEINVKKEVVR